MIISRTVLKISTLAAHNVTLCVTTYKHGMVVALSQSSDGDVLFGRIELMLVHCNSAVYFIVQRCQSVRLVDLGVHCLVEQSDTYYVCINAEKFIDYYPLPLYKINGLSLIPLHHAII